MSFRLVAQSLDPFMDPSGDVYIAVEVEGKTNPEVVPLESRQAKAVLRARLCDVLTKGYATDHEMRSAVEVIYGLAFERKRKVADTAVEYLIAQKPLAEAILAIARSGGTEATPSHLLAKVNTIASRQRIDTANGPWPHNEDSLGKQLSQLAPLLEAVGVKVERSRGTQRRWTIHSPELTSDGCDGQVPGTPSNHPGTPHDPDTCHASDTGVIAHASDVLQDDELEDLCQGAIS